MRLRRHQPEVDAFIRALREDVEILADIASDAAMLKP
jgi:hypothetical protein